jgi:hypothetical protein
MSSYRLEGGPRDGETTETAPEDYNVVRTEVFEETPEDGTAAAQTAERYVATWRGDEPVVLTVGPDLEDGDIQLIRRADLPAGAYEAGLTVPGEEFPDGEEGVAYEVWVSDQ